MVKIKHRNCKPTNNLVLNEKQNFLFRSLNGNLSLQVLVLPQPSVFWGTVSVLYVNYIHAFCKLVYKLEARVE